MTKDINSIIVYGSNGTGKTTMVAKAMPKALWIVTRKGNLTAYHDWIKKHPEQAAEMGCEPVSDDRIIQVPSKQINPDSGELDDVDTQAFIDDLMRKYCLAVANGKDIQGVVFDEFSVFVRRVFDRISAAHRNGFEAIKLIKKWVSDICEIPVATDRPMCLICHGQDPKYDDDTGKLKYPGGPAMPIGTMVAEICALPDAVLQMAVKANPMGNQVTRVLRTEAHPEHIRKIRLWGIEPEIEPDLRKLLQQGGW